MNCELLPMLLSAALDDELSSAERSAMQHHLEECPACREQWVEWQALHRDLGSILQPSTEAAVERLMRALPNPVVRVANSPPITNARKQSSRRSQFAVFTVICALLVLIGTVFQWSGVTPAVAEISLATGPVEYKPTDSRDWIEMNASSRVALPARARVRTKDTALCEIRTKSDAVVRLNKGTELVVHQPEKVELVAGELWCRAPASASLEICTAPQLSQPRKIQSFTCPSATEMQWTALPDKQVSCMGVAGTPAQIKLPEATCTIQPGDCLTFNANAGESRRADPLQATRWQLPLLLLRNPRDSELQDRLTSMLAYIGETKAAHMYESQIRELGPAGAVPLLAFVRSPESRKKPQLRWQAMHMASELAASSSLPDLEVLLADDDPAIRKMAAQAIRRLQPDRDMPVL